MSDVSSPLYTRWEYPLIRLVQRAKNIFFLPLVRPLSALGIRPTHVSTASALSAVMGAWLAYFLEAPSYLVVGLALHLVLDGLDGTLARALRAEGPFGARLDVVCDLLGLGAFLAYLGYTLPHTAVTVLLCGMFYSVTTIGSFALGLMGAQLAFLVRPRIFIYGAFILQTLWAVPATMPILQITTVLMLGETIYVLYTLLSIAYHRSK